MKILQIGTIDNSGGAASVSWSIKKELEKQGFKMTMFVRDKNSTDKDVRVIPQKIHKYIHYLLSNDLDLSYTDWILETKEFKNADIIHLHNLHGWFFNLKTLEKISKLKPIIWTLHDMWAITPHCAYSFEEKSSNGFYNCPSLKSYPRITWHNEKYLTWKKKQIYKNSKINLVVPSIWLKNKVKNSILNDKKIDLIYNGIDENIFNKHKKNTIRQELKIPTNKKVILFLSDGGKNNLIKGWEFAEIVMKSFETNKNVIFICLGGNESGRDIKYNNLLYVSRINEKETLSKYMSASDILLFPSLADNCPLIILEAMACELPIVTFDTGGIPELVQHLENGYISKYEDTEDLIRGVNYILNLDEQKIIQMGKKSREKILEKFTLKKMVDQYENLYKKIIEDFKVSNKIL
jgi:glycosyltransferase involved in cell wall biosynthesis